MTPANFRVSDDGAHVEVDVTITVSSETIMHGWPAFARELQQVTAVVTTKIDDLPPALITATMEAWREEASRADVTTQSGADDAATGCADL